MPSSQNIRNFLNFDANTLTLTANKYRLGNVVYDDMQGIASSVAGGSALGSLAIRDTGITIPSFQDGNDDVLNLIIKDHGLKPRPLGRFCVKM